MSTYVYSPLQSYLHPSLTVDEVEGEEEGEAVKVDEVDPSVRKELATRDGDNFRALLTACHAGTDRPLVLARMIRTVAHFMSRGTAVDPHSRIVRLPGDYGSVPPPSSYGINGLGKIEYLINYEETAVGAAAVILVRKFFHGWKKVVGFKLLCRVAFTWGRQRILKQGWGVFYRFWRTLKTARSIAYEEGCLCLKLRMFSKWGIFARKTKASKVVFVQRSFVRKVHYLFRAWRAYAHVKGKKKRAADRVFRRNGVDRGFGLWRTYFVERLRLKKFHLMIKRKRVAKVLRSVIGDWCVSIYRSFSFFPAFSLSFKPYFSFNLTLLLLSPLLYFLLSPPSSLSLLFF